MEQKLNVAEFAALVGTTSKTIYGKIQNYGELPVNEQLRTVREKVKGREVTLIVTNSEQIEYYKNLYGKNTVNDGEYYETLTDNNGYKLRDEFQEPVKNLISEAYNVDIYDKFITFNENFNNRLEQKNAELMNVYKELSTVKQSQLLLEDKASREGMYINEINDLKKENNRNQLLIKLLITVIVMLFMVIVGYVTFTIGVNNGNSTPEQNSVTEEVK